MNSLMAELRKATSGTTFSTESKTDFTAGSGADEVINMVILLEIAALQYSRVSHYELSP
jgi:hypothetical protein